MGMGSGSAGQVWGGEYGAEVLEGAPPLDDSESRKIRRLALPHR